MFSIFYKKSYSKKNKGGKNSKGGAAVSKDDDQCQKAMGEISMAAKEVANHAAKDAGKLVASASKAVKRTGAGRNAM